MRENGLNIGPADHRQQRDVDFTLDVGALIRAGKVVNFACIGQVEAAAAKCTPRRGQESGEWAGDGWGVTPAGLIERHRLVRGATGVVSEAVGEGLLRWVCAVLAVDDACRGNVGDSRPANQETIHRIPLFPSPVQYNALSSSGNPLALHLVLAAYADFLVPRTAFPYSESPLPPPPPPPFLLCFSITALHRPRNWVLVMFSHPAAPLRPIMHPVLFGARSRRVALDRAPAGIVPQL